MLFHVRGTKDTTREDRVIDADSAKRAAEIYEYQAARHDPTAQLTATDETGNETRWLVFDLSAPRYESFPVDSVLAERLGGGG
jgi:hypothetical protein